MQSIRDDEAGYYLPRVVKYLLYAFTAAPLSAIAGINLLAWRASVTLGHWPVPWQEDPKCILPNDMLYQVLLSSVGLLFLTAITSVLFFPLLMLLMLGLRRRTYSVVSQCIFVLIFVGGWVLFKLDPGANFIWFID